MSKGRMSRMEAMSLAFEFAVKSGIEGDYYEFGVYRGNSLVNALRAREQVAARFGRLVCPRLYAFDSFAGLPPLTDADKLDGYDAFDEGTYACSQKEVEEELRKAGVSVHDLRFVPGFYDQSLKAADTLRLIQSSVAAIVHIDCDLYSSAADCLAFLNGYLEATVGCEFPHRHPRGRWDPDRRLQQPALGARRKRWRHFALRPRTHGAEARSLFPTGSGDGRQWSRPRQFGETDRVSG